MNKIIVIFILLINSSFVFGQSDSNNSLNEPSLTTDSIPFVLTEHNNISIQAIINQIDTVNLMLHTAANSVTLIKEATERLQSIKINGIDTVNSWGGDHSSKYSTNNEIQIGNQKNEKITIWENKNSGPNTDGKFGLNFFENRIIEINFDERYIKTYQALAEEQILNKGYKKFALIEENGFFFISAISKIKDEAITNKFLIHSGFGGAVLFDDLTADEFGFATHLKIIKESQLKDSYGNVLKTKKAILPEFLIAEQQLSNVPIGFFEGSIGRQKMSVIGGDVIKRFDIVFDIQNANIFLKPNSLFESPFLEI